MYLPWRGSKTAVHARPEKSTRDESPEPSERESAAEDLTATIAQLTQDIADANAAIKELDAAMAKETQEREDSKAYNTKCIKEAKEAQVAVEEAMAVLKRLWRAQHGGIEYEALVAKAKLLEAQGKFRKAE